MSETILTMNNYELDDAGTEREEVNGDEILEPFDPTKIRVATQNTNIDLLLKRIEHNELDLSPAFQREADIWSSSAQSRLIESILIRIPIPAFYFDATDEDHWLVVDGLQRLTALKKFVLDKSLKLSGLEFLTNYVGYGYDDLPSRYQRRIMETQVIVYAIEVGTPPEVKFNIFKRINTGGLPLSPQEIRHALNQGPITNFLQELARDPIFLKATTRSVNTKRMTDRELVLRFLAFTITPYTEYPGDYDNFLNMAMADLNKMSPKYKELKRNFLRTMKLAIDILGADAFRKRYYLEDARYPVNKTLFETWAFHLSKLSDDQAKILIDRRDALMMRFINQMNEKDFNEAVSQGTGDRKKLRVRFDAIGKIIAETLK